MAGFLDKSQVSVSAPKEDVAVKNLGADLMSMFGAVGKAAETYNVIGETAAKLEFQSQSIEASNKMTSLQEELVKNPNNPDAVLAYRDGMDAITTSMVANRDGFKNHKAAYDTYNSLASEFSASARSKYVPASAKMYIEEGLNKVDREGNIEAVSLGRNVMPANISIHAQKLESFGVPREDAIVKAEKLFVEYNIQSTNDYLNMFTSEDIQSKVTADDGTQDIDGAIALFNEATGSNIANVTRNKDGVAEINVDSENSELKERYSSIWNKIINHWSEPKGDGDNNFFYTNLQNSLGKPTLAAQPLDFQGAYASNSNKINDLSTDKKKLATLTDSQLAGLSEIQKDHAILGEKYEYLMNNGISLMSKDSAFTDVTIAKDRTIGTVTGDIVVDVIVSKEDIEKYRQQLNDKTSVTIAGGSIPDISNAINTYKKLNNGTIPPVVSREVSSSLNGFAPTTMDGIRSNVKVLSASLDVPNYGTKDQVISMRDLASYGASLDARVQSKEITEERAVTLYEGKVKNVHEKLKAKKTIGNTTVLDVAKLISGRVGFDTIVTPDTRDSMLVDMGKVGDNLSPEEYEAAIENMYTTSKAGVKRLIGYDSYTIKKQYVPNLKTGSDTSTLMTDDQMWSGIDGSINFWIDDYNAKNKASGKYVTRKDFDYEIGSQSNGNTMIKIKKDGVTVKETSLNSRDLYNRISYKKKPSKAEKLLGADRGWGN